MFDDFELSGRGGKPRHLFVFMRQALAWRFGTGARDVVIGGNTYLAAPIARSEIKQTVEKPQDQVTITFPYMRDPSAPELPVTQSLGDNWFPYVPGDTVGVVCMAYHANDPDLQTIVEWQGRVAQPKFTDGKLELTCLPSKRLMSALRQGPKWQRSDWKVPYAPAPRGMGLLRADYEFAATLTAVSGLTLTAAAFATSTYNLAGGELSWTRASGIVERRMILSHTGTSIMLLYGGAELAAGLAVTALPTCGHTWADFAARGNTDEYGGSVYMPIDDAYNGQSMSWG